MSLPGDMEISEITLTDGTVIPAAKAVCPTCKVLDLGVGAQRTDQPMGGWALTCSQGHQWVLQPVGKDGWAVLLDMGGGIFAGTYEEPEGG